MKNLNKGCYLFISPDISGGKRDYVIEVGGKYDCFKISVNYVDLISIKNEIIRIEEKVKNNEKKFD